MHFLHLRHKKHGTVKKIYSKCQDTKHDKAQNLCEPSKSPFTHLNTPLHTLTHLNIPQGCYEEVIGTVKLYMYWVTGVLLVLAIAQITVIFVNSVLYFRKHPSAKRGIEGKMQHLKDKTLRKTVNLRLKQRGVQKV